MLGAVWTVVLGITVFVVMPLVALGTVFTGAVLSVAARRERRLTKNPAREVTARGDPLYAGSKPSQTHEGRDADQR
ncbi:MAG: hypothetical protein JWL84_4500 [Rhodospirillales bacterium]|nr:hypothetical protein [Rhodospirillales bacterium]